MNGLDLYDICKTGNMSKYLIEVAITRDDKIKLARSLGSVLDGLMEKAVE